MKHFTFLTGGIMALIAVGIINCSSHTPERAEKAKYQPAYLNYKNYCAGCHGRNLEKFAAKAWMDEEGNAAVIKSIKFGIEDIGMPAFAKTFSDEEIAELAQYVKRGIPDDKSTLKPAEEENNIIVSETLLFTVDTIVSGLKVPWGLAFLPDGDMLIAEREGKLYRFSKGTLSSPIEGLPPIMAFGQGGLMDVCLHPDYKKNGWIYFSYSALNTKESKRSGNTAIMRARLKGNKLVDQELLYKGIPDTDRGHHFGCKLAFDNKGHLFFGIGERGQHFVFPQKLDNSNGKIHRINDDGTIPADNPFVNTEGALPSIYSYGHRNPQGTAIHPVTGELWVTEHGPRGGDEINLIKPGLNYGWPVISYGIDYDGTKITEITEKEGMEQPVYIWTPSIAPCGMTFVTGDRYNKWKNNMLVGSLSFKYLERVVMGGHSVLHTEKLLENIGRVRNVVMSPDGYVYVAIETPGKILKLTPLNEE
jgi:glucose/arabinose dehydrogenase